MSRSTLWPFVAAALASSSVNIQKQYRFPLQLSSPEGFLVTIYLEKDLDRSVDHAHPPAQERKEREDELDEVVWQSLKTMEPPRGAVHVIRHGVGYRLRLSKQKSKQVSIMWVSPRTKITGAENRAFATFTSVISTRGRRSKIRNFAEANLH